MPITLRGQYPHTKLILQIDLHTFHYKIGWENLLKHQSIYPYSVGDHFIYSHKLFFELCINIVKSKLMLVTHDS